MVLRRFFLVWLPHLGSLLDTCTQTPRPFLSHNFIDLGAWGPLLPWHWHFVLRQHLPWPGHASLALAAAAWVLSSHLTRLRFLPATHTPVMPRSPSSALLPFFGGRVPLLKYITETWHHICFHLFLASPGSGVDPLHRQLLDVAAGAL